MKNSPFISVLLFVLALVACKPNPEPIPDDGMRHDSLTATYDLFCNPERGFHQFKEFFSPDPLPLTGARVKGIYNLGYSLILTNYYLTDYMSTPIPDSYLNVVRQNMQALRDGGCKCVLRFAYTNAQDKAPWEAPLDTILLHISQLKPILQENADVIFAMEAGFIGSWGEWYYTNPLHFKRDPNKAEDFIPYRNVLDALLDALPAERQICVRTPRFKMKCYGWTMADTLTRAEAFTGTPKARLACHDDAFMADASDMGTFKGNREYWEAETNYTIYGGESNKPGSYANCDNTIAQMQAMHMSYLNISYHKTVIARWETDGCLEDMRRLLGYRLVAKDIATTKDPKAGQDLKVVLTLVNEGFSSPKNPRDIRMLLISKSDSSIISVTPDCDPRFWGPEGEHKVTVFFKPEQGGTYDICLYLPDPQPTLANDPRYAIRLANKDCWNAEKGYNYLTTITVQ
ncbi:MAG: DUF4832 domain-containing protein [Paludibacteraceae bacterium]|nr:DUF4832 domain-containing protein [Paludibacteraceae bacterium]